MYVLGDIIDRGPQSAEALIWAVNEAPSNVHFLLGNHEDMAYKPLLRVRDEGYIDDYIRDNPWGYNGGYSTLDSLRELCGSDWCHRSADWISRLPLYFEVECNGLDFLLVHAGLSTGGVRLSDDFISEGRSEFVDIPKIGSVWSQHLLWIRERWFYNRTAYPYDYIIFGHTPTVFQWWEDINVYGPQDHPIAVQGKPGYMIRMSGYGKGHMRYCIDTGRQRMGLLRLDDMMEFYAGE